MKSFKKGEILTADRLNELLAATADTADMAGRTVPPRPGIHAQPGLARFNMQVEDSCTGQVSTLPDYAGLLKSVEYAVLDAPRINRGNMILPLAHDYSPEDSSLPDESATGGVASINVVEGLKRAQINRGDIQLPLAQSSWPQTADGAMYTPGLVYGVQYDAVDDACAGSAYIEQGVIHLPPGGSGGGGGELPRFSIEASLDETWSVNGGAFRVGLADMCAGSAGVIVRVEAGDALALSQGVLTVPLGGGSLAGVVNTSGQQVTWAEMEAEAVKMAVIFLDGYRLYLTGQVINGFLKVDTEAV